MDKETVNAQRYLTLLRETVVPCLIQRGQIGENVTFMQNGATSHTANPVKAFLDTDVRGKQNRQQAPQVPWPPWSPDLTPGRLWLWGYLKKSECIYPVKPVGTERCDPQRSILPYIRTCCAPSPLRICHRLNVFSPVVVVMWNIFLCNKVVKVFC
ncbi:hypothetical protein TNCV_3729191 [Trichonephila clavipes]|nr:hypothetical protein TNCV_3729191 [Trichonephila clavipes]